MTTDVDRGPRVLIIEDEAITALDLQTELAGLGYEVCGVVDTADEAIRAAVRSRPALVLMDVRLADGGDGIETARIICSRLDTAIVFLTAHSDESTLARALEVSPFGYLIKPFRARELKVAVELALAKHARDTASVRHLHSQAMTDALTGLANRRQLDATLQTEWHRGRETGRPLALVLIDIDHFKALNDAAGHLAGDACLVRVAGVLRETCRCADAVIGRWGGEEFLVVLPGTDLATATAAAERIVQAIRDTRLHCATSEAGGLVTVSAGAAAAVPTDDCSIQTLLHRADRGLYAAKHAGRDRVGLAPAAELQGP